MANASVEPTPGPENNYGNPPTSEMLSSHTLASRTIANHNTPRAIFDISSINLLRAFVADPSPENQRRLLLEHDMLDAEDARGADLGKAAVAKGDLAGYMIARYGKVEGDESTFYPSEVAALKEWFDNGGGQ